MKTAKLTTSIAFLLAANLVAINAHAGGDTSRQEKLNQKLTERFTESDSDGDGKLTAEEAKAGGMRFVARKFEEIDQAQRGSVTLDDIKDYLAARAAER